jgi:hypothetical protein
MASKTGHVLFRLLVTVLQAIDQDAARKRVKNTKATKLKVQSSIQDDRIRVPGKKRDDLQYIFSKLDDSSWQLSLQTITTGTDLHKP